MLPFLVIREALDVLLNDPSMYTKEDELVVPIMKVVNYYGAIPQGHSYFLPSVSPGVAHSSGHFLAPY